MKKKVIVLSVTILTGALVVSALAGSRWGRGRGGGHIMGYGGGPGSCWNQGSAGQWGQEQYQDFQDPESKQIQPRFQGQYGPGFGRRYMGPGWGGYMVNPYQGMPGWRN